MKARTVVGVGLSIGAALLLYLVTTTAALPRALTLLLIGSAVGTAGLVWATPQLARRLIGEKGDKGDRIDFDKRWSKSLAFLFLTAGGLVMSIGLVIGPYWLLYLGLLLALPGAALLDIQVDQGDVPIPAVFASLGLFAMVVGAIIAVIQPDLPLGLGNIGQALVFLGFPILKVGLPGVLEEDNKESDGSRGVSILVGAVSAVALAVGAILLVRGALHDDPSWIWVAAGFSSISIGYALVVEIVLYLSPPTGPETDDHRSKTEKLGKLLAAAGVFLVVVGVFATQAVMTSWDSYLAILVVAALGIGGFFALRGEAGLFVLLLGVVLIWVGFDRTVGPQDRAPAEQNIVIGVGDSYMAGQGAHRFYDANNTVIPARNLDGDGQPSRAKVVEGGTDCRRSPQALPAAIADQQGDDWASINLACSGAVISEVLATTKFPLGDRETPAGDPLPGTLAQLDELRMLDQSVKDRVRLVVVSIGGNDSGFSDVIKACLLPADCSAQVGTLQDELPSALADLSQAHVAVAEAAKALSDTGPDPQVVVVPYPEFLDDKECGLTASPAERDAILRFQRGLNQQVIAAATTPEAAAAGVTVFADGVDAFTNGLKLCDNGGGSEISGANFLYLMPHDPLDGLNPANWVQGSMHPRPEGHTRMAEALLCWFDGGSSCVERHDAVVGDFQTLQSAAAEDIGTWTDRNLRVTVSRLAAALSLIMGGGLLIALGLFHAYGRWPQRNSWLGAFFPRPWDEGMDVARGEKLSVDEEGTTY